MKDKFLTFLNKLKNPKPWVLVVWYLITLLAVAGTIVLLVINSQKLVLQILSYCLYGVSAITFGYTVYTIVLFFPKIKNAVVGFLENRAFTNKLLKNYGFRTIIFSIGSFIITVAFSIFNTFLGIYLPSVWYGALAGYYLILSLIKGGILFFHKNKRALIRQNLESNYFVDSIKTYRNCGILLIVINVALSAFIAQMIFDQKFFSYPSWTIFAVAAYAFYKITMAIINLVKAKKYKDYSVQAIRNINLTSAMVSILALQTALLHAFGGENISVSLYNTLTGSLVSLGTLALGVYMVVNSCIKLKKLNQSV